MTEDEIKAYKEEQRSHMTNFKIGQKDLNGYLITKIFARGNDYIVYEIQTDVLSESLRVLIHTIEPEDPKEFEKHFEKIKSDFNEIKAILYKAKRDNSFKHIIASAVTLGITGDIEGSKKLLLSIKNRINAEYKLQFENKLTYLSVSFLITILLIIFSYIFFTKWSLLYFKDFQSIPVFIYVITGGALGGAISLSLKLKKIEIETELSKFTFMFYGLERMLIAIFASIISLILIKSNIFFGVIKELDNAVWGFIAIGILAGFSETLIPDVLNKIEKEKKL